MNLKMYYFEINTFIINLISFTILVHNLLIADLSYTFKHIIESISLRVYIYNHSSKNNIYQ